VSRVLVATCLLAACTSARRVPEPAYPPAASPPATPAPATPAPAPIATPPGALWDAELGPPLRHTQLATTPPLTLPLAWPLRLARGTTAERARLVRELAGAFPAKAPGGELLRDVTDRARVVALCSAPRVGSFTPVPPPTPASARAAGWCMAQRMLTGRP
jgi:hypothetical protein